MLKAFKEFAMKGNVLDLAVGFIIGAAFGKIVTSLVADIIMPPIGLILGKVDFSGLFVSLSGKSYATLAEAKAAGAPTLNYGLFLNNIVDFVIVAFAVFLIVQMVNQLEQARAGSRGHHQGMSVLRFVHSAEGHALPELHVGSARASGLRNSLPGRIAMRQAQLPGNFLGASPESSRWSRIS